MSPRLRPRGSERRGEARGRLIRLDRLGQSRVAVTLALDPGAAATEALLAAIAAWETQALKTARRRKTRSAPEFRRAAPRLRLRPSRSSEPPALRLLGPSSALDGSAPPEGGQVRAQFSAAPVILPAAGIVALEFRLSRLLAAPASAAALLKGDHDD